MEHKLGIGHYQISGVLGYNADGAWGVHGGISSPKNKRIKDIVDGEKVYYADAEPCDIPEDCRLDVRIQMPEDSVWNLRQKGAEVAADIDQIE